MPSSDPKRPALNPVTAVTQPEPYPYYAELVSQRPSFFDEELNALVLSSAGLVRSALAEPMLRVRPVAEPVPAGIVGTAAGAVFGQLVRMTDGPLQQRLKGIVCAALGSVDEVRVRQLAGRTTDAILEQAGSLDDLLFQLPARVVAGLCGLTDGAEAEAARLIGDFVLCLPATATAEQQAAAAAAAERLQELMAAQLADGSSGLLAELVRAARRADWSQTAPLLANAVGFLSQTYDATAALIGNTLVALGRENGRREGVPTAELGAFVREVARHDPPVHNTRRFAAASVAIGGQQVQPGQSVLVLLAAANRDPVANQDPAEFRPDRGSPTMFTFGSAGHRCPGEQLAVGIATGAVARLLAAGLDPAALRRTGYRPSGNIRCPQFDEQHRPIPTIAGRPAAPETVRS
jgi:cytochrome P450